MLSLFQNNTKLSPKYVFELIPTARQANMTRHKNSIPLFNVKYGYSKNDFFSLTLSWRRSLSYRNQSINLRSKSMDWSLYDNGFRHERVNYLYLVSVDIPISLLAGIYFFKVNNNDDKRTMFEICSELICSELYIKTSEQHQWCRSCVFLLTLKRCDIFFWCFHCWSWARDCYGWIQCHSTATYWREFEKDAV